MPDPAPEMERISMMNRLKAKLKKQGGFTLVEMLVVVAIVAILIAISIPMVGSALEKAREATDDANYRDAAALGNIILLSEDSPNDTYWYVTNNSAQGVLKASATAPTDAYTSQCTHTTGTHGKTGTSTGKHIKVVIDNTQTDVLDMVKVTWE